MAVDCGCSVGVGVGVGAGADPPPAHTPSFFITEGIEEKLLMPEIEVRPVTCVKCVIELK